ncbi:hypothetical protein [Nocardia huaxiensis]|uniref:Uncharacterized protein n=1 Tax=Nocardia huaxiensis TaxID=2755382 RepID=A0A7D6ZTU5_9NOCA|nr:hypothetical protein [Nocardia huaxiensis]QLY33725.1 hypothetical protein H0264_17130 [Nocardia huaxiensis]UFS99352.1 hypothetical protein LPY97_16390 [Nocardia huaxiensis]
MRKHIRPLLLTVLATSAFLGTALGAGPASARADFGWDGGRWADIDPDTGWAWVSRGTTDGASLLLYMDGRDNPEWLSIKKADGETRQFTYDRRKYPRIWGAKLCWFNDQSHCSDVKHV